MFVWLGFFVQARTKENPNFVKIYFFLCKQGMHHLPFEKYYRTSFNFGIMH